MKRFIVSLPDALDKAMRASAARSGEKIAVWVREAIREKLLREREQA